MSQFTYMKKNLSKQVFQDQIHIEPLITLNIKLGDNKYNQVDVFEDSIPYILASKFVAENNLELDYTEPLKQNIIEQMRIYDYQINQQLITESEKQTQLNQQHIVTNISQNKENKKLPFTQNDQTKPEKRNMNLQIQKLQSEQMQKVNLRKNKSQKSFQTTNMSTRQNCFDQKNQNLETPKINQEFQTKQLQNFNSKTNNNKISFYQIDQNQIQQTKNQDTMNISFSEESQFKNDSFYTSAQIENSLGHLLKTSDERIINRLYIIIQTDKIVDPRKIPYEEFNYQLIVELRQHFKKHNFKCMNKEEFQSSVAKNHTLLKQAAIFFQI